MPLHRRHGARNLVRVVVAKSDVVMNNYTADKLAQMGFPTRSCARSIP